MLAYSNNGVEDGDGQLHTPRPNKLAENRHDAQPSPPAAGVRRPREGTVTGGSDGKREAPTGAAARARPDRGSRPPGNGEGVAKREESKGRPSADRARAGTGGKAQAGRRDGAPRRASQADRASGGRSGKARQQDNTPPELPHDVSPEELGPQARKELRGLPKELADTVARHLVMADRTLDTDPDLACRHVWEARRRASRVAAVREGAGFVAYRAGQWFEALGDLRAARRMTGSDAYLPMMADCERGMGRPRRALEMVRPVDETAMEFTTRVEMCIVESGARADMGQYDAAVAALEGRGLWRRGNSGPYFARLCYAYADALSNTGRDEAAERWLARAAAADEYGDTDAAERIEALDLLAFVDAEEQA